MEQNKFQQLIDEGAATLVTVSATWCGPCKMFAPIWQEVSQKLKDKINFVKIDADECENICAQLGVSGVPTTVIFRLGQEVARRSGSFANEQAFTQWIEGVIA